jgi:hypothetical protein
MIRAIHRLFIQAVVGCFFLGFFLSAASAQQWAADMFTVKNHSFGKVPSGSNTQFAFEFKNKYQETVHVQSVRSTCGCTIPTIVDATVKSRQTGKILATFNTKAFLGPKSATVTVVFDKPFFAEVQLTVSGEILSDVNVTPAEVAFGQVSAGAAKTSEVTVSFLNRPNIKIEDVRSLYTDLKVQLAGPVRQGNRVDYNLKVTLKDSAEPGEIGERLTLVTNDPVHSLVVIGVTGRVKPPVEVKPDTVHFGSSLAGTTASERLLLRAETDFEIKKIVCEDPRFTFEIREGAKKVQFVKMTFTPGTEKTGEFKVPVTIQTDLGDTGTAVCLVTGLVSKK